ncbi:kinase-like domain-containing protein [Phlyctochytrium arcticum]|nr:kinase-like domain-containing protein [Phlyctochytrium arcticum]
MTATTTTTNMVDYNSFNPQSKIGEVIDDGRLTLVSILGMGSFAVVYLAQDTSDPDTVYAVKCLFKHNLTPTQLQIQHREAAIMAHLSGHPNIVHLYKKVETDECLYLVMEYCDTDLFDLIEQRDGLNDRMTRTVFNQLLDALEHCHRRGIYHRDLKPENVLVIYGDHPTDLTLKLTDFGLATSQTWSDDFGCGSVRYMAPETLNATNDSDGYNPAANDVWGLGIMLVNLLTGQNPWAQPSSSDALFDQLAVHGPHVVGKQFGFSRDVTQLLARIFDLDPVARPTIKELRPLFAQIRYFSDQSFDSASSPVSTVPDSDDETAVVASTTVQAPIPDVQDNVNHLSVPTTPAATKTRSHLSWSSDTDEMDFEAVPVFESPKPVAKIVDVVTAPPQQPIAVIAPIKPKQMSVATAPPPSRPVTHQVKPSHSPPARSNKHQKGKRRPLKNHDKAPPPTPHLPRQLFAARDLVSAAVDRVSCLLVGWTEKGQGSQWVCVVGG